jgi:hypothetical protein
VNRINRGTWILLAVLFAVGVAVIALLYFRPWELAFVRYGQNAAPFSSDEYVAVKVVEDDLTPFERLNPVRRRTRAEELLADKPAGTEVYEFEIDGTERIWRTPEGDIYIEKDSQITEITAYRKPLPTVGFEFRPKVMTTTDFSTVGIGAELDLLRLWHVHLGPGAGYNLDKTGWVGAGGGYNVWKNVDVGGYGGKTLGAEGWNGGLSVGVAIE